MHLQRASRSKVAAHLSHKLDLNSAPQHSSSASGMKEDQSVSFRTHLPISVLPRYSPVNKWMCHGHRLSGAVYLWINANVSIIICALDVTVRRARGKDDYVSDGYWDLNTSPLVLDTLAKEHSWGASEDAYGVFVNYVLREFLKSLPVKWSVCCILPERRTCIP